MANITTGLTKNASNQEGVTAHYKFAYDSTLQKNATNPTGAGSHQRCYRRR